MRKEAQDAKRDCLKRLIEAGTKEQLAGVLAVESKQVYTRCDYIHRAR